MLQDVEIMNNITVKLVSVNPDVVTSIKFALLALLTQFRTLTELLANVKLLTLSLILPHSNAKFAQLIPQTLKMELNVSALKDIKSKETIVFQSVTSMRISIKQPTNAIANMDL